MLKKFSFILVLALIMVTITGCWGEKDARLELVDSKVKSTILTRNDLDKEIKILEASKEFKEGQNQEMKINQVMVESILHCAKVLRESGRTFQGELLNMKDEEDVKNYFDSWDSMGRIDASMLIESKEDGSLEKKEWDENLEVLELDPLMEQCPFLEYDNQGRLQLFRYFEIDYWIQKAYNESIQKNVSQEWKKNLNVMVGGKLDCIELTSYMGIGTDDIFPIKILKIYYQKKQPIFLSCTMSTIPFEEGEIKTVVAFMEDMGIEKEEAERFCKNLKEKQTQKSGTIGDCEWSLQKKLKGLHKGKDSWDTIWVNKHF